MALSKQDYETIKVNKTYKAIVRYGYDDTVKEVIEYGDLLMEEENGGNEVLKYEEVVEDNDFLMKN